MLQDKAFYEKRKARFAAKIPHDQRSWTIPEFCFVEQISEPTYYRLKEDGLGPEESRFGGLVRISPASRAKWHEKMRTRKFQRLAKIESERRSVLARRANKASIKARQRSKRDSAVAVPAE